MYIVYSMHRIIGYILVLCWCSPNAASSNATHTQTKTISAPYTFTYASGYSNWYSRRRKKIQHKDRHHTNVSWHNRVHCTLHANMHKCTKQNGMFAVPSPYQHHTEKLRVNGPNRCQDYRGCHQRLRAHCTTRGKQKHRKHNAKQEHIPQIVMQDVWMCGMKRAPNAEHLINCRIFDIVYVWVSQCTNITRPRWHDLLWTFELAHSATTAAAATTTTTASVSDARCGVRGVGALRKTNSAFEGQDGGVRWWRRRRSEKKKQCWWEITNVFVLTAASEQHWNYVCAFFGVVWVVVFGVVQSTLEYPAS